MAAEPARDAAAPSAPPSDSAPPCPFCGSSRTELVSAFGSHASLSTCWCSGCRSPFELLRWRGGGATGSPDGALPDGAGNMDPRPRVE